MATMRIMHRTGRRKNGGMRTTMPLTMTTMMVAVMVTKMEETGAVMMSTTTIVMNPNLRPPQLSRPRVVHVKATDAIATTITRMVVAVAVAVSVVAMAVSVVMIRSIRVRQ